MFNSELRDLHKFSLIIHVYQCLNLWIPLAHATDIYATDIYATDIYIFIISVTKGTQEALL